MQETRSDPGLPIDPFIPQIVARVRESRAVVIVAAPGAGKTTRVAPALAADGPVILLQPRRVAARSIARRIAAEQGWTAGHEVGWHVRFEQRFRRDTRLLVATEGILTARLQQDPLLSGFRTIILDEFHERSIHADLAIALARQAWRARDDLQLVVMSATMAAEPVAAYLDGAPIVDVPGRGHPIAIEYAPGTPLADAVRVVAERTPGHVLCFLPGAPEIARAMPAVRDAMAVAGAEVVPLHGGLDAADQDRAIAPSGRRRVVLATNIAETSLTVPGVTAVVDSGLHKVARYDPDRAIDSLETERIPQDSADQRAGRAGRLGPGLVRRLWSGTDRLRPHREADVHRIDLSGPMLDVIAWGGDPRTLEWFEAPAAASMDAGLELLRRLGAIEGGRITPLGRQMQRLPLHPRLARILVSARGSRQAALSCALLSERHFLAPRRAATSSDLLSAVEHEAGLPPHIIRVAEELQRATVRGDGDPPPEGGSYGYSHRNSHGDNAHSQNDHEGGATSETDDSPFRRAVFHGYPDRVAKRREPGSPRLLLASGHGALLGAESGVGGGEYLVAIDVQAGRRGETAEARVRVASIVERSWLAPTDTARDHELGDEGAVRAVERDRYGALVLDERVVAPDPAIAARLLADAFVARGVSAADEQLLRRLRFAGIEVDVRDLARRAAEGCRRLDELDLERALEREVRRDLDRLAPPHLAVPSGRVHRLEYREDGSIVAAVKLQELFGLAETPRIGRRREPVVLALLAPNGRPVQMTRDLASFWRNTYPEVRRELRGRYPRHPWPEDPWSARPTARTKGRS